MQHRGYYLFLHDEDELNDLDLKRGKQDNGLSEDQKKVILITSWESCVWRIQEATIQGNDANDLQTELIAKFLWI